MRGWRNVRLLGLDIGYSKNRKTTGVAIYRDGNLCELCCVGSSREERRAVIAQHAPFHAVSIDGPLLPQYASLTTPRFGEYLLSGGAFARRCKPGLSHFGQGLELRRAAMAAAQDEVICSSQNSPIVAEAFPTGFLGVMIDDAAYDEFGELARGSKSDVFYRQAARTNRFDEILRQLAWRDGKLLERLKSEAADPSRKAHDHRAALVCLLTAACALRKVCEHVGDDTTGSIALPPIQLWAPWAVKALAERMQAMETHPRFLCLPK